MSLNFKIPIFKYNGQDKSVTLIDGTNMFYRACTANHNAADAELSIMVSNFAKMFKKALKFRSKYVAIVFDSGQPNFRHKLLSTYKSNRKTHVTDKDRKLKLIKAILHYYGFKVIDSGKYESDDVIGSLAHALRAYFPVQIVSEDKDFLQCVRSNVRLSKGGLLYSPEMCLAKFGIEPRQFIDYLCLVGDSVDCIPGADRWGKKNAAKYLAKCGAIEDILDEKLTKSLMSIHKLDLNLTRKLVRIKTNLHIIDSPDELSIGDQNTDRLRSIEQTYKLSLGEFL